MELSLNRSLLALAAAATVGIGTSSLCAATATTADVIIVVDESGSMSGEHAWVGPMIQSLDAQLIANGLSGNRYGLVGFGGSSTHGLEGHGHDVAGGQFGSAADFANAALGLVISGSREDGYSGIDEALDYNVRSDAALNVIFIADEDRDIVDATLDLAGIKSALQGRNALLNVVVNAFIGDDSFNRALGLDSDGNAYLADGSGGFTSATGYSVLSAAGNSKADYIDLALELGGAAWDLNQLRAGGTTADSFTSAFINVKVQEITTQPPTDPGGPVNPIPLPAAAWTGIATLLGMSGYGKLRRRRSAE